MKRNLLFANFNFQQGSEKEILEFAYPHKLVEKRNNIIEINENQHSRTFT